MIAIPDGQDIEIAIEEFGWESPDSPRVQNLSGKNLVEAFRRTARILDEIGYENFGGGNRSWNPKNHRLYWGLVWLKNRAAELNLIITSGKPTDDMDEATKLVTQVFDGMYNPWVIEILNQE